MVEGVTWRRKGNPHPRSKGGAAQSQLWTAKLLMRRPTTTQLLVLVALLLLLLLRVLWGVVNPLVPIPPPPPPPTRAPLPKPLVDGSGADMCAKARSAGVGA
jgi:hypothetical protein